MERASFTSGGWSEAGTYAVFGCIGQAVIGNYTNASSNLESGLLVGAAGLRELIRNGGFEEPARSGDGVFYSTDATFSLPGWKYPLGGNQFFLEYGQPFGVPRFHSGRQVVTLNSDGGRGELSQVLRTRPGGTYRLRFAWAEEGGSRPSPAELEVSVGSLSTNVTLGDRLGFALESFDFVALSNRTVLRFVDRTPANSALHSPLLDDVSVVGPPSLERLPKPGDWLARWFYSRGSNAIYQVFSAARDGSDEQPVAEGRQCRLSPDGRWLVVERGATEAGYGGDLWLRNMISGEEELLVDNGDWIVGFGWFPDSTEIIYDSAGSIRRLQIATHRDLTTALRSDGYDDAPAANPRYAGHFVWHNINRGLGYGVIYTNSLVDGEVRFPPDTVRAYAYPDWAPDGLSTCYTDGQNLFTASYPFNASFVAKLTGLEQSDRLNITPRWHPDGTRVYAAGIIAGRSGIYEVSARGGVPVRVPLPEGLPIAWIGQVPSGGTAAPLPVPRITLRPDPGQFGRVIVRLALPVEGDLAPEYIEELGASGDSWRPVAEVPIVQDGDRVWDLTVPVGNRSRFFRVRGK